MTSSRRERGEQGRNLDERFAKFLENYDDDECGELEEEDVMVGDEVEGNDDLHAAMDEFMEDHRYLIPLNEAKAQVQVDTASINQIEVDNAIPNAEPEEWNYLQEKKQAEWDCETVVSTYSNLENHPQLLDDDIQRIKISKKTGIALGVLPGPRSRGALKAVSEDEAESDEEAVNLGAARIKNETKEEKKQRKKMLQEEKRQRRSEKKSLKQEFKTEEGRQKSVIAKNPRHGVSVKHLD